jgi:hypothetical protein
VKCFRQGDTLSPSDEVGDVLTAQVAQVISGRGLARHHEQPRVGVALVRPVDAAATVDDGEPAAVGIGRQEVVVAAWVCRVVDRWEVSERAGVVGDKRAASFQDHLRLMVTLNLCPPPGEYIVGAGRMQRPPYRARAVIEEPAGAVERHPSVGRSCDRHDHPRSIRPE